MLLGDIMSTHEILILGGPNSGKTHYAGQLYGRLKRLPSTKLRIRGRDSDSTDLTFLEGVLTSLENGNATEHTPTNQYAQINFPLIDEEGSEYGLSWPDYGGEQIKQIFKDRSVPAEWRERLQTANGWMVFIRLSSEVAYPFSLEKMEESGEETTRPEEWDANAKWIELMQILCHVAGTGVTTKDRKPSVAIMLSCFDELGEKEKTPEEVLMRQLPLFYTFLCSNWSKEDISIWGLSSLGKTLTDKSNDDAFVNQGPEYQGWVIPPSETTMDSDLTRPLFWLLGKKK